MEFIILILIVTGIIMIITPSGYWKIRQFLNPIKEEPTELYLKSTRIQGIAFIIIAIISFAFINR